MWFLAGGVTVTNKLWARLALLATRQLLGKITSDRETRHNAID